MHRLSRVVTPVVLSVDGEPVTDGELAIIAATGPDLQRWWLAYGYAVLVAGPIVVPERGDVDRVRFHTPGQAFWATQDFVAARYPQAFGGEHIPLVWLKGVNAAELGSLGWGALGFAAVSWDTVVQALERPAAYGHWPAGIAAHEIGHGLGWPHSQTPEPDVMWEWWQWPGVGVPPQPQFVALSVHADEAGAMAVRCPEPWEREA